MGPEEKNFNQSEFLRQAVLHICGNLEIEEAMMACLRFLRQVMPADRMYVEHYDHNFSAMRTIAVATPGDCQKLDQLTPLSDEARESAGRTRFPGNSDVFIFNDPRQYAISREMLDFHRIECTALMTMFLKSKDKMLGALALLSEGKKKYTQEHARLLALLKEPFFIAMSNTLKHREVLKLTELLADDNRFLHGELRRISGDEIVGANFGLRGVIEKVRQVAQLDSPVLLLGETGTGKDVIANAVHYTSSRTEGPFVGVNCGAIPETLVDSELFGHEKGAFTGAVSQKRGRFERAHGGTIFLDEIAELPLEAQVRLLRVLQNKEIERVGGTRTISLDIRVIAATNKNLEERVKTGQFREDLWFRLNVFPIIIPPLRDRASDIPALLQHFLSLKARELKLSSIPEVGPGAVDMLMAYDWPGNVRELQNIVERALILNPAGPISFEGLLPDTPGPSQPRSQGQVPGAVETIEETNLEEVISRHIRKILDQTNGKIHGPGGAAELLGINASTLRNRLNKMGIHYGRAFRQPG